MEISIKNKTKKELEAYIEGFQAGLKMAHQAIDMNGDRFINMVIASNIADTESEE